MIIPAPPTQSGIYFSLISAVFCSAFLIKNKTTATTRSSGLIYSNNCSNFAPPSVLLYYTPQKTGGPSFPCNYSLWCYNESVRQFREECGFARIGGVSVHTYHFPGGTRSGWRMFRQYRPLSGKQ